MPFEFISKSEAKARGLLKFYQSKKCRKGHDSERYVSNGACMQCVLDAKHGKLAAREREMMRPSLKRDIDRRLVLGGDEQAKAVDAFARAGSYQEAADSLGITVQQLSARRASNEAFDLSMKNLEAKFASGTLMPSERSDFKWTPENRGQLIDKYIDTGDLAEAR